MTTQILAKLPVVSGWDQVNYCCKVIVLDDGSGGRRGTANHDMVLPIAAIQNETGMLRFANTTGMPIKVAKSRFARLREAQMVYALACKQARAVFNKVMKELAADEEASISAK